MNLINPLLPRLIALWAALLLVFPLAAAPQPNILFVLTDDQRADTIGALGNDHISTPRLDELVRAGTTFTRTYCMGSRQGAVCVPSRAMIYTGRTLFRVKDNLDGQPTWPEKFGQAGYRTFLTGKWHNQGASAVRSFKEARAVFLGGMGHPFSLPVQDFDGKGAFTPKRTEAKHSVVQFTDAAVEFLKRQKAGEPFLACVAFNLPHDPRVSLPESLAPYDANPPPLPANFLPVHPFDNGWMTGRDEALAPWPRTPEIVQRHLAEYYGCVSLVDEQVGRLLDTLRERGLYDNTLIVFTSDHGLAIGSHGLFGKQNLYEHSMRAPLIFAGPGIPKDKRADAFSYLFDIFPTLGELAGLAAPAGVEGLSLAPVIRGAKPAVRDSVFTSFMNVHRAVRDDRWKLIVYPQINRAQLFDLRADPDELRDVSASQPAEVARLTALLKEHQAQFGDTQPLRSETPKPSEFKPPASKVPLDL
jgi:arylsulfatase A-like enzyme